MKITLPVAKINGQLVHGQAHIQPGSNHWIGVCIIKNNLIDDNPENRKFLTIDYEGPFNCGEECINGKGKAKVLHISSRAKKNRLIINIEGIEDPQLEKKLETKLTFSYNENLPVDLESHKKMS